MIDVKKLFNKGERGTHKGKVKVTRGGKIFYREQMVGKKEVKPTIQVKRENEISKFKDEIKLIYDERKIIDDEIKIAQRKSDEIETPEISTMADFKLKNDAEMEISQMKLKSDNKTRDVEAISNKISQLRDKEEKRKAKLKLKE